MKFYLYGAAIFIYDPLPIIEINQLSKLVQRKGNIWMDAQNKSDE